MCFFLCSGCDDGSDEENYYILLDQYEEEDVYGDLIALKNSRVHTGQRTTDALGRQLPVSPVNAFISLYSHSFLQCTFSFLAGFE